MAFLTISTPTPTGSMPVRYFRSWSSTSAGRPWSFLIENAALPADQFPAFLADVKRLLATLRFPA